MHFDTRGLKVMIAENDRAILELLQIRLNLVGFHTCIARSGPMALETLRTFRPAALVLDLNLPELDGFGLLQAINPRGERLPFPTLVMARKLAVEDIQRAVRLGARDCMAKPFSGADILERIQRLLRRPAPSAPSSPAHATAYV
ncbi:response regulator transcription factor [Phenylobacterium aquaticum]|uniref:response regulator transcription factor n=1 Tax=Phenylobacterium aquaticum TaxID=1763816 RepID=UPI001F5CDD8D|nr:response regulator [Phenylobacterium aquaticum]MCI3133157.1 response regulator [Phenylobacterium aquaticum]